MPSRTIAFGDIHGCSKALECLLKEIAPGEGDELVLLGDYVDRGPDSRGVLELLIELQKRCRLRPLLGNHELMLLGALEAQLELGFWLHCGGDATLSSYGGALHNVPPSHVEFVRRCLPFYETENHIFVHANYDADAQLDAQPEQLLFWEHLAFTTPGPHLSGKIAIVGHTPQPSGEILDLGHLLCLDTYCFGDGWLTALDVSSGQSWQADKQGRLRHRP